MFYWNQNQECTLKQHLLNCDNVTEVNIASAYFSSIGVQTLQEIKEHYQLTKKNIKLYISTEFSSQDSATILRKLQEICEVRIVTGRTFHPKVYWFRGAKDMITFGSSNFTSGGLSSNIEFNTIFEPSENEQADLIKFFSYCKTISTPVTDELINYYINNEDIIANLHLSSNKLRSILNGFGKNTDPDLSLFENITNSYFNLADYETFFIRNQKLTHSDIRTKRQLVQAKMLKIHEQVYPSIKQLGIAHHKREENITSSIYPSDFNRGKVEWLGVRYGKTPEEIKCLAPDNFGFQKHACLQFSITSVGFEINLFFAVRNNAIDRDYVYGKFDTIMPNIICELKKLKGYGLKWVICDANDNNVIFDLDVENIDNFKHYFYHHDSEGKESYLMSYYEPDDINISCLDNIKNEVIERMQLLLPLYNTMAYRPNV